MKVKHLTMRAWAARVFPRGQYVALQANVAVCGAELGPRDPVVAMGNHDQLPSCPACAVMLDFSLSLRDGYSL